MKRLLLILLGMLVVNGQQTTNLTSVSTSTGRVGTLILLTPVFPSDNFESYTANAQINGLNSGYHWNGAYVDRLSPTGIYEQDDFESYSDAAAVDGLNGGNLGWSGAYVDRINAFGLKASDDLESYSDAASVNGLNGGTDWGGAFVDR